MQESKRKKIIAGNWKMHGLRQDGNLLAAVIAEEAPKGKCDIILCPPATLLGSIAEMIEDSPVQLGAQDCHDKTQGAFTGDISAAMLKDMGCSHVIVGHSERRRYHQESDDLVRRKAEAAHAAGLTAIICIGETAEQRAQGLTMATISTQLDLSIPDGATADNTIIAYEPVWAIGTGLSATAEDAQDVHSHCRLYLSTRFKNDFPDRVAILYGGSMKADNAKALLAQPDIDGGLIGGASLVAADFLAIIAAV